MLVLEGAWYTFLITVLAWFPIKSPFLISPPFHRIQDKIEAAPLNDAAASKVNLIHCRPEVFRAAWLILGIQDSEFLDAYLNGMVV